MSEIRIETLPNGLTLLIDSVARPAAGAQLLLQAGSAVDPEGGEGACTVLHDWVQRGAGSRDTKALSEAFDALGIARGGGAGRAAVSFTITGLADDWSAGLELLADIVLRPWLADDQFEPCRQLALQELASLEDDPGARLRECLQQHYFPGPYGRPAFGTQAGLEALTPDSVRSHWEAVYSPKDAILAVCGGLQPQFVRERVEELFGDWRRPGVPLPPPATDGRPGYAHVSQATEQVHIGLAYPDVPPDHPARYHALMAMQVMSGGMGSRLFTEVREKRGLCYSVGAGANAVPGHGFVTGYAGTTTERSSETLEVMLREFAGLPGTVAEDEVERGRVRLLSNTIMADESTAARVERMVSDYRHLGRVRSFEEIRAGVEAVTAESLNAHLEAHPPGDYTIVTLGETFVWPAGLRI